MTKGESKVVRLVEENLEVPSFTEDALALEFTLRHGEGLRYVDGWGKWLEWNGHRWAFDQTVNVFDLARQICREAAATAKTGQKTLSKATTVAAVEKLAKADRKHAATVDQWDTDPWLLNTPDCVIDLETGDARQNRRDDYCTKLTTVAPGGTCPLWFEVLKRATDGDGNLVDFLQRVFGYGLTGITREHALFFVHGYGANSKSTIINTVAGIMGDYHTTSTMDTFTASYTDRHPTELAALRGARLVTAVETEEGRRWAESRIKALTGGDPIAARFMRQDLFTFTPTFKLIIAGNHKPKLRNIDEAMRRRLHLIPFEVVIPEAERDETLPERLKAEWPGILEWMIDGCLKWQTEGLQPPERVTAATKEYFTAEDALAIWIEERCHVGPDHKAAIAALFASWSKWAAEAGETIGSQRSFSEKLHAHGYERTRLTGGTRGFLALQPMLTYEQDYDYNTASNQAE
jgi:putative DNA primase/helicase